MTDIEQVDRFSSGFSNFVILSNSQTAISSLSLYLAIPV